MGTFKDFFIEGYKDNPRDLRAMKKSGTRGSGIDPNDLYTSQEDRKDKVQKLRFEKLSKKDANSPAFKSIGKYAQKLGIKASIHNLTLQDWQDEGRNPDGDRIGYALYMTLEIDGRKEQIYVESNYDLTENENGQWMIGGDEDLYQDTISKKIESLDSFIKDYRRDINAFLDAFAMDEL